ncbi:SGNH/GDSL hydrolase family protein [Thermoproteota archaeon]
MFGILVLGDSISFGRGESPNIGWAGRLKSHFEPKGFHNCLYNLGVPGDTSTMLLQRFEKEIRARVKYIHVGDKFLIMIAIGINDSLGWGSPDKVMTSPKRFRTNINKMLKISKKHTENVILVGLTPVNEDLTTPFEVAYLTNARIKEYDNIIKESATKGDALFIDLHSKMTKLPYKKLLADGLHPNKKGYEAMYRIIKEFLVKNKLIA